MQPIVEIEETTPVTVCSQWGTDWTWCYGSPLLVRVGERLFTSLQEIASDIPPRVNTRPRLFARGESGWECFWRPDDFREREPCPIGSLPDGSLMLSYNPFDHVNEEGRELAKPQLLRFSVHDLDAPPQPIYPKWDGGARFNIYSYRGIGCDASRNEILLLHIYGSEECWSYRNAGGDWVRWGRIRFPIRACYPQVALHDRAAHVLAIGDIVEPNEEWRRYKYEVLQRDWDYAFRRLFYTWTPDIATADFAEPLEVDTVDGTGGHITNLDLWLDPAGDAHLIYLKQPVVPILQERFFPDIPYTCSIEHCVIRQGEAISRSTLALGGEGISDPMPVYGRLHATPDGRLYAIYSSGPPETRIAQIWPQREEPVAIPLEQPLHTFFTATERGGSPPSDVIELLGEPLVSFTPPGERPTIGLADVPKPDGGISEPRPLRYARVRLARGSEAS